MQTPTERQTQQLVAVRGAVLIGASALLWQIKRRWGWKAQLMACGVGWLLGFAAALRMVQIQQEQPVVLDPALEKTLADLRNKLRASVAWQN